MVSAAIHRTHEGSTRILLNAEMSEELKTPSAPIFNKSEMKCCFLSSLCAILIALIIGLLGKYTTIGISVNIRRMTSRL